MKHNMLQSFYNYIVNDLLLGWLKESKPANGSRYCMVVENDNHRQGIMNALKEKIASESSALLADCVAKTLDKAIRENLDAKQQSKMIDDAIAAIEAL